MVVPLHIYQEKVLQHFAINPNTKFHKNPSNSSRVAEGRTNMPFPLPYSILYSSWKEQIKDPFTVKLQLTCCWEQDRPLKYENAQQRGQRNPRFQISYIKVILCKAYLKFLLLYIFTEWIMEEAERSSSTCVDTLKESVQTWTNMHWTEGTLEVFLFKNTGVTKNTFLETFIHLCGNTINLSWH